MAARQRMRSRTSRPVIVGHYHRESESSELLGTAFSASTDDLEDSPHSGKRRLCVEMIPLLSIPLSPPTNSLVKVDNLNIF